MFWISIKKCSEFLLNPKYLEREKILKGVEAPPYFWIWMVEVFPKVRSCFLKVLRGLDLLGYILILQKKILTSKIKLARIPSNRRAIYVLHHQAFYSISSCQIISFVHFQSFIFLEIFFYILFYQRIVNGTSFTVQTYTNQKKSTICSLIRGETFVFMLKIMNMNIKYIFIPYILNNQISINNLL